MVGTGYMTRRTEPVSPLRRFVNQRVFPAAIDAAAELDQAAPAVAALVRRESLVAFALSALLGFWLARRVRV